MHPHVAVINETSLMVYVQLQVHLSKQRVESTFYVMVSVILIGGDRCHWLVLTTSSPDRWKRVHLLLPRHQRMPPASVEHTR